MGYIIPITQYEYIQYTNRSIESQKASNPLSRFQPVLPVKFHHKNEENYTDNEHINSEWTSSKLSQLNESIKMYKNDIPEEVVERMAVEVTGLGQYVNEYI